MEQHYIKLTQVKNTSLSELFQSRGYTAELEHYTEAVTDDGDYVYSTGGAIGDAVKATINVAWICAETGKVYTDTHSVLRSMDGSLWMPEDDDFGPVEFY